MRREDQHKLGDGTIDSGGRSVITGHGCTAVSLLMWTLLDCLHAGLVSGFAWQDEFSFVGVFYSYTTEYLVPKGFQLKIAKRLLAMSNL
jgi:hypothetical protein